VKGRAVLGLVIAALGVVSVVVTKLAIPAMMSAIIVFLTIKRGTPGLPKVARAALMVSAPFILVAVVRFVIVDAMPGILEGSRKGLTTRAIAALREIRFTQDVLREQAFIDPDKDGVGSAGFLEEISGHRKLRGRMEAPPGLIQRFPKFELSPFGPFTVYAGYGFIVYLPTPSGEATAQPDQPVDEERAERRYLAYAWPMVVNVDGEHPAIHLDQHERIWITDNKDRRYVGAEKPPPWNAALPRPSVDAVPEGDEVTGQDGGAWRPWKGKAARDVLPGDVSTKESK
jgi:hypothetical protein